MSYERFMASCPNDLKPFEKAYQERKRANDEEMFTMARYIYEAVVVGVDNVMNGSKSKLEYRTKSFSAEAEEKGKEGQPLSKKQIAIETQKTIAGLNHLKDKFEAGKIMRKGG